ncbi:histidine kinase [Marinilabilia rubra]|uniref:Histidine kinase n=1 Tax=Marinilabilia rubra TaxID=2162893 RepID=A0A2U2BEG2_9BACT|nr:histidine kinase [Marinilabilia rubra]
MAGWCTLFLVHTIFLTHQNLLPFNEAIIDAFIYNFILMIIGLALYFPLTYSEYNTRQSSLNKVFIIHLLHHTITGLFTLIIWLGSSFFLAKLVFENNPQYMDFARSSLPVRAALGSLLLLLLIFMYHFISFYQNLEEKSRREEQLKKMVKEAELKALKAQLNPHFLFNSLNSISSLTISKPEAARQMLTQLSDFLRYSLRRNHQSFLPLNDEITNMKRYLDIEKVRFGERLISKFDIPEECLNMPVPAMLLQPVYENAIKHGLYESIEPVTIQTTCRIYQNGLRLSIVNNFDPDSTRQKGEGVGLENIRNKLYLFYNRKDLISISKEEDYFEVSFILPKTH